MLRQIANKHQQLAWYVRQFLRHENAPRRISVIDVIPSLIPDCAERKVMVFGGMHSVPEQKMRAAERCNQHRSFLPRRVSSNPQPRHLLQANDTHQNEETSDRGDVVNLESRKEIRAQREDRQSRNHPDVAVLPEAPKESQAGQIERGQKEKAIEAHAIFQALEIAGEGFRALMKRKLHFVIYGLLRRKLAVRNLRSLNSKRSRHAILVLAEHFRRSCPTAGHLFALQQCQENRRKQR